MQRSKRHFLRSTTRQTGAIIGDSHDLGAVERRETIMRMTKPRGTACLSLGCGLGRFLRDYVKHRAKIIVGLDINRRNLNQCKEIKVDLVLGDVENLPFVDNAFDVIDCEATMEHIARPITAMKENYRVLKQTIGLSFVTWHVYLWTSILTNPTVRRRFVLYTRDLIANFIPKDIILTLTGNRLFKVLLFDYGTYRNAGFSYPKLQKIYREANMKIVHLKAYNHVIFIASRLN